MPNFLAVLWDFGWIITFTSSFILLLIFSCFKRCRCQSGRLDYEEIESDEFEFEKMLKRNSSMRF